MMNNSRDSLENAQIDQETIKTINKIDSHERKLKNQLDKTHKSTKQNIRQ